MLHLGNPLISRVFTRFRDFTLYNSYKGSTRVNAGEWIKWPQGIIRLKSGDGKADKYGKCSIIKDMEQFIRGFRMKGSPKKSNPSCACSTQQWILYHSCENFSENCIRSSARQMTYASTINCYIDPIRRRCTCDVQRSESTGLGPITSWTQVISLLRIALY